MVDKTRISFVSLWFLQLKLGVYMKNFRSAPHQDSVMCGCGWARYIYRGHNFQIVFLLHFQKPLVESYTILQFLYLNCHAHSSMHRTMILLV